MNDAASPQWPGLGWYAILALVGLILAGGIWRMWVSFELRQHEATVRDLQEALNNGTAVDVEAVLADGIDPDQVLAGKDAPRPLHLAAGTSEQGAAKIAVLLDAGADPMKRDRNRRLPLQVAAAFGDGDAIVALVEAMPEELDRIDRRDAYREAAMRPDAPAMLRQLFDLIPPERRDLQDLGEGIPDAAEFDTIRAVIDESRAMDR